MSYDKFLRIKTKLEADLNAAKYDGHLTSEQDRNNILNKLDEELRKL